MYTKVREHRRQTRYGISNVRMHTRNANVKSLGEYERITLKSCPGCGGRLERLQAFPNEEGWKVKEYPHRMWLFKKCRKCGYEWPATYLGAPKRD